MRTGRDTQAVKIASCMVDNCLAIYDMQCAVRTSLETLPGATAFTPVDQNLHHCSMNMRKSHCKEVKVLPGWLFIGKTHDGLVY